MPPALITSTSKARLERAADTVLDHINNGDTPNDAAVKAAITHGVPVDHIPLFCRTLNAAMVEGNRRASKNASTKLQDFPLADSDAVIAAMSLSTATRKEATHRPIAFDPNSPPGSWYTGGERYEKIAKEVRHAPFPAAPPVSQVSRPFTFADQVKIGEAAEKSAKALRGSAVKSRQIRDEALVKIASWFNRHDDRLSFKTAQEIAAAIYGNDADHVLRHVAKSLSKTVTEKAAGVAKFDQNSEPFKSICTAVTEEKKAADFLRQADTLQAIANNLRSPDFNLPQSKAAETLDGVVNRIISEKTARSFGEGMLGGFIGSRVSNMMEPDDPADVPAEPDIEHMSAVRSARVTSLLSDLLANDDVIRKFQPQEVLHHYNEIARTAPNASLDPSVTRPLLRKRLEGGRNAIDPYDTDLLLKLERQVRPSVASPTPGGVQ